jgi:hypothetical protein
LLYKGEGLALSLLWFLGLRFFWPFFGFPFCLPRDGSSNWFLLDFSLPNKEEGTSSLPSFVPGGCASFGLSLAFPFVFQVMVPAIGFCWIFLYPIKKRGQKLV